MSIRHGLNVSRETFVQLEHFVDLVKKWTPKINLISKASVPVLWQRHIADSMQVFDLAPPNGLWVDLGSGGGFPAIVAAIMSKGGGNYHQFILIESDQRKCAFLRTAVRELELNAMVRAERAEFVEPLSADILTARALTDLTGLLSFADRHLAAGGTALFSKGENWLKEHEAAQAVWSYSCENITSTTNAAAAVLRIQDIVRV
jgi:16S rRNA (guanine527-N7)-methyltransferase